ncbi:MAG: hypothetical protein J0H71_08825 [Rhizobiales bacterium]|nr:hypothetical protein [Hyphomicrobiales bacterium]
MRIVRYILIVCLALGLTVNGLLPAHAMPCASAPSGGMTSTSVPAHHHAQGVHEAGKHHASSSHVFDAGHGAGIASPDHAADHNDHAATAPACNCGCFSLCGTMSAAPARVEVLERQAIDVDYVVMEQAAPDGIQFIDPGIPILTA